MIRSTALSLPPSPSWQHIAEEEYAAFLERYSNSYRDHLLLRRKQFVQRYPDLQNWFQLSLPERVGRLHGETRSRLSYPVSFHARQYLFFLLLRGHILFDWEWLIAIERLEIWDFLQGAGIEVHLDSMISLALKLGYSQESIQFASQWGLSRLFLHTGMLPVERFSEDDLIEFADAIRQFVERPDVALFYGSREHYQRRAQSYLGMLFRLHLVLYHQGRALQPPRRPEHKHIYPRLHKPRMEAVLARYLTARRLTDRPRTVKNFELALQRFIRWIEQAHPAIETFAEVTRDHVLQFAEEFDTLVHPKTKRPPGAGSKLIMLGRLAVFFRDLACWGWEDVPLHP